MREKRELKGTNPRRKIRENLKEDDTVKNGKICKMKQGEE